MSWSSNSGCARVGLLVSLALCVIVAAPPVPAQTTAEAFGFPATTPGTTDVRIWLGGGIVVPTTVYRMYEDADGEVRGQIILWLRLHDDTYRGRPTNRDLLRLMRKNCESIQRSDRFVWCEEQIDDPTLRVTMNDLQLDRLVSLSDEVERDCGWLKEDGESVTIDVLRGDETYRLSISNPDFCCAEPVCAFVSHARAVVERNMRRSTK